MKLRDARLAVLDTNVFGDLASLDAARQAVTAARLDALRKEGLATVVTGSILTEIATVENPTRLRTLLDTVANRVDFYLPLQAGDLVKIEVKEKDPAAVIGNVPLYPARDLPAKALDAREDSDSQDFFRAGGLRHDRLRNLLPKLDPEIRKLTPGDIPTFREHVERSEEEQVRAFLESANAGGELGEFDGSPDGLRRLLDRGKSTRMAVLMILANHYRRAKKWVEDGEMTKAAGALSDTRIMGEGAYCQVLLTADKELVACGALVNEVVREPEVREWDLG